MAQRTVYVDDITKKEIPHGEGGTVRVGLDGQWYEVDLSDDSKAKLEEILKPYMVTKVAASSSRTSNRGASSMSDSDKKDAQAARAWAQTDEGKAALEKLNLPIPGDRGRVKGEVVEAWRNRNA